MKLESAPKDLLQTRVDSANQQRLAYTDLQARLSSLRVFGQSVQKTQTFSAATTASSDENVLTGTASDGAAIGSFTFQVARLVTTQQAVSRDSPPSIPRSAQAPSRSNRGVAKSHLKRSCPSSKAARAFAAVCFALPTAAGIRRTSTSSAAVTLDDVIKKINTSLDISVRASISGDKLKLTDTSGQSLAAFNVTDLADGHAAEDLGLAGVAATGGVITGGDVNYLSNATTLNAINDGRGIRKASSGNDIAVTAGGTTYNISLASAKTLGDVFDLIKTGTSGAVTASADPAGNGIQLTGSGAISVADIGDSKAATDLGIATSGSGTLTGGPLLAGLDYGADLLAQRRLGAHPRLDPDHQRRRCIVQRSTSRAPRACRMCSTRSAAPASTSPARLTSPATASRSWTTAGAPGTLTIAEAGGTTAADLGLLGSAPAGTTAISGTNLQRQWVSENTLLTDYNGGKGVSPGSFRITNSTGNTTTINLATGTKFTLGDVIRDINSKNIGVKASINAHGDGLLLYRHRRRRP